MTRAMNVACILDPAAPRKFDTSVIRELFASGKSATPTLLLSRSAVERNFDSLRTALPRTEIHYAVKSNDHPTILKTVCDHGGSFDVCSVRETDIVLQTGIDPSRLIHSHPIKSLAEFDQAVARGVQVFVVDNIDEVEKLRRYTNCRLKVIIRYRVSTNSTAVVNLQYKFGCTVDEVLPLAQKIRDTGHEFYDLPFTLDRSASMSRTISRQSMPHRTLSTDWILAT